MRFVNVAFVTLDSATLLYTYISRFSVNPHYISRGRKSGKAAAINFIPQPLFIVFFNFSHKWFTFAFTGESVYTLGFRRKIAHKRLHAETGGFRTGPLSLPSARTARSQTSPGRLSELRTLPFCGLGRVCSRRTQKACGTAMRSCASLFRRRRGPAGLRSHAAVVHSGRLAGMERLDQAFRQSYYHTQRPSGQPFGACAGAALGGKMRAITLDFKESHHGRT